jgi:hypothetical protein
MSRAPLKALKHRTRVEVTNDQNYGLKSFIIQALDGGRCGHNLIEKELLKSHVLQTFLQLQFVSQSNSCTLV